MTFRLWGLSLEQQAYLWNGVQVGLSSDSDLKGKGYHVVDRWEYRLLGWASLILQNKTAHHVLAALSYSARFGVFGFNLVRDGELWAKILVLILSSGGGAYIGHGTFGAKVRPSNDNNPRNSGKWKQALCGKKDSGNVEVVNPMHQPRTTGVFMPSPALSNPQPAMPWVIHLCHRPDIARPQQQVRRGSGGPDSGPSL